MNDQTYEQPPRYSQLDTPPPHPRQRQKNHKPRDKPREYQNRYRSMPNRLEELRTQLDNVYALMAISGKKGRQQVVFGEGAFAELLRFLELVPAEKATEMIYRLSPTVPAIMIAEVFNVLIWSAEGKGGIDLEAIAEWFYASQARKIEIALQVDIFPSNSMEESLRILEEIARKHPRLRELCAALRLEVNHRLEEEESWSRYRRETFEMPKEMTGSILKMIENIKR